MFRRIIKRLLTLMIVFGVVLSAMPFLQYVVEAATVSGLTVDGLAVSYDNGSWSSAGTNIDGSATGKAKGTCDDATTVTATLTMQNNKGAAALLTFNYQKPVIATGGSVTINGTTVTTAGSFSYNMAAGESITIVIVSGSPGAYTSSIKITDVSLVKETNVTTTFMPSKNGTYTVNGETISAQTSFSQSSVNGYALVATPESGYKFEGWFNETKHSFISVSARITLYFETDSTIYPVYIPSTRPVWEVGTEWFTDLGEALSVAQNKNVKKITLVDNGTLASGTYTVPSGYTLLIPYDNAKTVSTTVPDLFVSVRPSTPSSFRKLTMEEGANIIVNGDLCVNGKLNSYNNHYTGVTSGPYGNIKMNNGSSITLNNGARLYCWGYIYGDGHIESLPGSLVYEPFQICDIRGGSATTAMNGNDERVFPISQYYIQNIAAELTINYGAEEKVFGTATVQNNTEKPVVSFVGSSSMFTISQGGKFTKKYEPAFDRVLYEVYGDSSLNSIALNVGISVNSDDYVLPLMENVTLHIYSGQATINQDICIIPGARFIIDEGASVKVSSGKNIFVYDRDEWKLDKFVFSNVTFKKVYYMPDRQYNFVDRNLVDVIVDVNGEIYLTGKMYTTISGADITSSNKTGKVIFETRAPADGNTYQATQSGTEISYTSIPVKSAMLHNGGDDYTLTSGSAADTTYFFCSTHDRWETGGYVITFHANDGTDEIVTQNVCAGENVLRENTFTNDELTFIGWNTRADGSGDSYEDQQNVTLTEDLDLYAIWQAHEHEYEVSKWNWAEDYSSANVELVCSIDPSHVQTVESQISSEVIKQNNCTESGEIRYTATAIYNDQTFTDSKNKVTQPTGHSWNEPEYSWSADYSNCTAVRTCANGDHPESETVNSSSEVIKQPNCTEKGVTKYSVTFTNPIFLDQYQDVYDVPALGHDMIHHPKVSETCTEDGVIEYWECSRCGKLFSNQEGTTEITVNDLDIPASGHSWSEWTVTKPATCEETGETTRECTKCHEVETETIEALGHTPREPVIENNTEPTCTLPGGYDSVVYCETCGKKLSSEHISVPATGHTEGAAVEENRIEPTCTVSGSYDEVVYCTVCHEELSRETKTIAALGHDFGAWVVTKQATCTETGEETRECSRCGAIETKEIEAKGHTLVHVDGVSATCEETGKKEHWKCSVCNELFLDENGTQSVTATNLIIPAKGHTEGEIVIENKIDATCTADGSYDEVIYCTVCGKEISREHKTEQALGHQFSDWTVTVQPTCTATGTETRICSRCDAVETQTIDALGHDLVYVENTPATCTESGLSEHYKCSRCLELFKDADGKQKTTEEELTISALGHDFGEWSITKDATCTETGIETRECSRCDETENRTIDALGHDWGEVQYKWSADNTELTASRTCKRNDSHIETETVAATGTVTTAPGCTTDGIKTYTSAGFSSNAFSAQSKTETIPATGHTESEAVVENRVEPTCTVTGSYDEVVYCSVCGEELSRETKTIAALGHDFGEWTVTTEPTCTENGIETRECSRCDVTETRSIESLGHKPVKVAAVLPTCEEPGTEEHWKCSVCNELFLDEAGTQPVTQQELIIPANGHTEGEPVIENTIRATCTADGSYDEVVYCTVCGNELSREHKVEKALGHDFGEWVVTTQPTCTEKGEETRICSRCDDSETREVAALGHNMIHVDEISATCTKDGISEHYECTRCHELYKDIAGTQPISEADLKIQALGHDFGEWTVTKQATCTEPGAETRECSRCDVSETREIPALGHALELVKGKDPTCLETGVKDYYECSRCHVKFFDADGKTPVEKDDDLVIAALGHNYGEWKQTKAPTCTEKGVEERECSRCHEKENRTVDALGHTPGDETKENIIGATCTEKGSYDLVVRCTVCNEILSTEHFEDAVLGHDYGEWIQIKAPTCTENGIEERECSRCHEKENRSVDALGHTPSEAVKENEVAPTCTEDGGYDMVVYCSICHEELSREHTVIPANGHTPGETVIENVHAPTCTSAGVHEEVIYCTTCGATLSRKMVSDPATGHDWNEPTYTWADDYSSVTATRTCKNGNHPESETVNTTSEITKPATCEGKGEITYTAEFTNTAFVKQSKSVSNIEALGHKAADPVRENEVAATCTETGSYDEVVYCSVCNKELSRTTVVTEALGHDFGEWAVTTQPTCTEKGEETRTCSRCDVSETREIPALGHALELVKGKDPTCLETGVKDYYECSRCHVKFFDAEGKTPVEKEEDLVIAALGHNYGEWKQTKTPTCTEKGVEERECSRCHEKETREIAALGHIPGEETKENIIGATCNEKGSYDLVVRCTVCNEILNTEHREDAALGHDWNEPEYAWSDDNRTVMATRTCKRDKSHVESETAEVKTEIIEATCEEDSKVICTVEFVNEAFKQQRKEVAGEKALGHDWKFEGFTWGSDYSAAEGRFVCTRDSNHVQTISAVIETKSLGAETEITASLTGPDGIVYTETKKVVESDYVIRVYGPNRYYTSIKTARYLAEVKGTEKFDRMVITTGENFADALAGSYLANKYGAPVILIPAIDKSAYEDVVAYINDSISENGKVYVLGGTSAIPEEWLSSVNRNIERIQGANRYITNINILKKVGYSGGEILVCTGNDFADSLSASAVNMPILLVKDQLTDEQKAYLKQFSDIRFTIIGGTSAVSSEVEKELAEYGTVAERIAGFNRFATSAEIAKRFFPEASQAVLAYGRTFPDGLSGGPLAYTLKAPLLLAESVDNNVVEATNYCAERSISSGTVLGGPTLIEDGFVRKIFKFDDNVIISEFE